MLFIASATNREPAPWPAQSVHPDDEPELAVAWQAARDAGQPRNKRLRLRLRSAWGDFQPCDLRIMPLRNDSGRVTGWVATGKAAPAEGTPDTLDILRAVCETAADAIFVKDTAGHYLYANPRCAQLFGAPASEVVGSKDDRWFGPEVAARLRAEDRQAIEHGGITRDEDLLVGGLAHTFSTTKVPYHDAAGRVLGIVGIARDVGATRKEARAIRSERDMFATIAAVVPGAFASYRLRPDGSFQVPFATPSIVNMLGATPEELLADGDIPMKRIHPDDGPALQEALSRSARDMTLLRGEYRVLHPERGEIWGEVICGPKREPDGATLWHGVVLDVTSRKRAERELNEERDRLTAFAASTPSALCTFRRAPDGTYSFPFVSSRATHVYGLPIEVIKKDAAAVLSLIHADDLPRVRESIEDSAKTMTPWRCEYRVHNPLRGELWLEGFSQPSRDADGGVTWHGIVTDISERKLTEKRIRADEDRYRRLVDLLPDALFINAGGRISLCNSAFVRMMGASSAEQLLGMSPFEVIQADHHEHVRARMAAINATGEPAPPAEMDVVTLDGTRRRVVIVACAMPGPGPDSYLVILHDITQRERTEQLLGSVLESVSDGILTIDGDSIIRAVNPATTRLFGHERDELIGRDVGMLMPEVHATSHKHYLKRGVPSRAIQMGRGREVYGLRKDGSTFPIEITISGFTLHGVQHYTGVVRDITARKKLEDQFRQAHKMEAFGQLAGGVAHDFNNLLTVILGETEVLASAFPADSPLIDSLNAVYDAGQRATGLTKQLLAFSRRTVLEPRVLDLNEVVRETERMLRRLIGEDIRLSTRLVPNLRHVNVDASQLSQVLMNLAVNARDAMPKGGSLDLETQNVFLDEEQARPHGIAPGPYVQLSVRDSGSGMSANVRARIFQPFFTTKSVGKGTGLGLAVVHGVVTQSGGAVSVESVEGAGTTFHIWLPVAASSAPAAEADDDLAAIVAPGPLLVVEDDDAVRKLALRALAAKGYDVRFARDGAEALDVIEQSEPFALIITDVVMPNMGGMDLSREVAAKMPDTKFLYVSGYTDDVLLRSGIETDRVEFLTKPYTPTALVHAVRRALAAKASVAA